MTISSSVLWAMSGTTFGIDETVARTQGKSPGVIEVAERILGYRLVSSDAASAMGVWSYADEDLRIAESFLEAALEVWPEY